METAGSNCEVVTVLQQAVEVEKVDVMTVTVGTQRRAVLEAIAFGSFLRDIETHIDSEYRLLTPGSTRCPRLSRSVPV